MNTGTTKKPFFARSKGDDKKPEEIVEIEREVQQPDEEEVPIAVIGKSSEDEVNYPQLKTQIHHELIERLDMSDPDSMEEERVRKVIRQVMQEMLRSQGIPLNQNERAALEKQVRDEIFGLGPLEPLLEDPSISDILVNSASEVWIEREGKLFRTTVQFKDEQHLKQTIDRIVSAVGRRIDEKEPMVDARLADGSRVNAIIPPLAIDGSHVSIRKFKKDILSAEDLVNSGSMTANMLKLLAALVKTRRTILISGGTGSGKTTLLNILSSYIPARERIVTIEDSAELQMQQPHVVRLETRKANVEGEGEVSQRQLVINSLRMRPDRVIIGEVRGGEAIDMLQAMNTGHEGSMATVHANTPRDALGRLETMVTMAGLNLPEKAIRQQVVSAIHVVVQASRMSDGKRRLTAISEIVGMEGEIISMQDIFYFDQQGINEEGEVVGEFKATGIRPKFADYLSRHGVDLPGQMFTQGKAL